MIGQHVEVRRRGRPRTDVLGEPALWADEGRLFPIPTFLSLAVISCAWAATSRLDSPIEGTVLCILASIGLSTVFVDRAAAVVASSVVPLWLRRAIPALLGMGLATATWLVARFLAVAIGPAPDPDGWNVLEWATIASSQVAVGAVAARRRPDSMSFGPGVLVGLGWGVAVAAPRLHPQLFDPQEHLWRWLTLFAASVAVASAASLDPAQRFRAGGQLRARVLGRARWHGVNR
jgi:hypothetical protein